jgi:hypothetical protein
MLYHEKGDIEKGDSDRCQQDPAANNVDQFQGRFEGYGSMSMMHALGGLFGLEIYGVERSDRNTMTKE